jgi:hypothetical protein
MNQLISYFIEYIVHTLTTFKQRILGKATINFHTFLPEIKYLLIPCIILFILPFFAGAQETNKEIFKKGDIFILAGSEYDDNILKYSDIYIEKFKRGVDEGRFHISTYDDIILHSSLQPSLTFEFFKRRETKVDFEYSRSTYIKNNIKTWNQFSLGVSQDIHKRGNIKITYDYIPYFYLRHYRDDDWVKIFGYTFETFKPQSFSKENYGLLIQYFFFKDTRFRFSFNNSSYFYNEHFTEYDCRNFTYGLTVLQPVLKKTKIEIGIQFETSDTKDLDKTIYTLDHYSDASNKEGELRLEINRSLPRIRKINHYLELRYSYARRYYTTKNYYKYDPIHAGRIDDVMDFHLRYNLRLNSNMRLIVYYDRSQRFLNNSLDISRDFLMEEKNYKQNLFGILITYDLKIKK